VRGYGYSSVNALASTTTAADRRSTSEAVVHERGRHAASYIARWDGAHWSTLLSGVDNEWTLVSALTVYDDGSGPALYAGGRFRSAGSVAANRDRAWNGSSWSPLGSA
jgi:hypothetical protein